MAFLKDQKRTHFCGDLRASHEGQTVVLMGWVENRRDHGGLVFIDLRDREGLVQVVLDPQNNQTATCKDFRGEFVVAVEGKVQKRPDGMTNTKLNTGEIEVTAEISEILSEAQTPPFDVSDERVHENLRLQYRYLEIRSPHLQEKLRIRHKAYQVARNFLAEKGFLEVETPILYKSTPEGARDYLVPSRVHPGSFYALPQSPQTLKQLLMIGGMDRYFQIARCFRDEDLRADRQPEFTQIDLEMSFVDQDDVIAEMNALARRMWKDVKNQEIGEIPIMTYDEAMQTYGSDKPDLRFEMKLVDVSDTAKSQGFKVFDDAIERGGCIKAISVPGAGQLSRAQIDKLTQMSKNFGAKGLVWIKSDADKNLSSPISKFFSDEVFAQIFAAAGGVAGGAVFMVADSFDVTCNVLGQLRLHFGNEFDLIDRTSDRFLWVVDFPLLDYDADNKRWAAKHHPFTMPKDEHVDSFVKCENLGDVYAKAYDLVCNGYEIGGGSIRIHRPNVQKAMFKALGLSEADAKAKFGFFIEALQYGTPPHGGFAWGFDRMVMILAQTDAIRDVIAFPKTTKASDLMASAPNRVDRDQLIELGIRLAPSVESAQSTESDLSD